MPDVKEQTEATEVEEAPVEATAAKENNLTGLLTKVAIFGVISLVAVFAAYLLTVKVLKPMMAHSPTPAVEEQAEPAVVEEEPEPESHGGGEASAKESNFYTIESIVVNPAGTAGTRFLSCTVSFEMSDKDYLKAFEALDVQIKDLLITVLSSKTVDELADITSRNKMRREMLTVVNRMTAPAKAKAVYLTDFVLQ